MTDETAFLREEVAALQAVVRKVSKSVGWWAGLSYVDHCHGKPSRWTEDEQALLHRAGL